MKHFDYEINLFVDGELGEVDKKEMFIHLSECEKCRNTLSDFLLLKEKSRLHIAENIIEIKNTPKKNNLFYKIGFYSSAAAAIVLLFLLTSSKPKETFVTKNEVRIDTIFVKKEIPIAQNKIIPAHSITPGKRRMPEESSQKEYLRYVMNLRTEKITKTDKINSENGSIQ
jgi:uncharacterized membrane protein (UPF0127 family)